MRRPATAGDTGRRRPRVRTSPTIFDVARLAGVSHQTVSRVINNHASVRETHPGAGPAGGRAAAATGRTPRRGPWSGGRSRNIGLITTGSSDYGPTSTVLGLLSAARAADYSVSLATAVDTEPESVQAAVDLVLGQHVEALVVVASRARILDALAGLNLRIPVVVLESSGRTTRPSLSIDQYAGRAHGDRAPHRASGTATSPTWPVPVTRWTRPSGCGAGATRWPSTGWSPAQPLEGDWTPGRATGSGGALTQRRAAFTALFVANDQMSLGCIHALAEQGIRVPEDVSIVGFDDIPEAEHFAPPLTTMRQDFRQLGTDTLTTVLDGGRGAAGRAGRPGSPRRWSSAARPGRAWVDARKRCRRDVRAGTLLPVLVQLLDVLPEVTPSVLAGLVRHAQGGGRRGVVAADDVAGGSLYGHPHAVAREGRRPSPLP